jgi:hypothetical protein
LRASHSFSKGVPVAPCSTSRSKTEVIRCVLTRN